MHPIISALLTLAAMYRAYSHKSLTPTAILTATLTSIIHAIHPFSTLTILLLFGFYGLGTWATKVKHNIKSKLTVSATGDSGKGGGGAQRTYVQVLANSGIASVLILWHWFLIRGENRKDGYKFELGGKNGWRDGLIVGVMTHYAATTADTLGSELGILSTSKPRLIYNFKTVPPGTNGGITPYGTFVGILGSAFIGLISILSTPFAPDFDNLAFKVKLVGVITVAGTLGSLLDSFLGATLQASVIDIKQNKIVESSGGEKVLVSSSSSYQKLLRGSVREKIGRGEGFEKSRAKTKAVAGGDPKEDEIIGKEDSRKILTGMDVLSNNGVNLTMAGTIALGGVLWGILQS